MLTSTLHVLRRMCAERGPKRRALAVAGCVALALAGCAQLAPAPEPAAPSSNAAPSASKAPPAEAPFRQRGRISLYGDGDGFSGKRTASGDVFDPNRLTMAHPTLPFGTRVRVTNLENDKSVEVVVNDRGPFVQGRIADLSAAAARQLGMTVDGVVDALLEIVQPSRSRQ